MRLFVGMGLAALLVASVPAGAVATISSTFDSGTEGWQLGINSVGGSASPINWDAATQSINATHGWGGGGFIAPTAYLGNKSDYIGGTFSFDFSTSNNLYGGGRPLVVLTYGEGKQIFLNWSAMPTSSLKTYTVDLTAGNFYNGSETGVTGVVTVAQFAEALSDLKRILIWGDWTNNVDTIRLDNVSLKAPVVSGAVPEPASWATMIAGFGLAGATLRSRRRGALLAIPRG